MATVRLHNLIKPRESNTQSGNIKTEVLPDATYTDLYLDLKMQVSPGVGLRPGFTNDIKTSLDRDAIKNSIYNILYTRPGQKLLDPSFGSEIHNYLFEPVSKIRADALGHYILNTVVKYEPRILIIEVVVVVDEDDNTYKVDVKYEVPSLNQKGNLDLELKSKFDRT